MNIENILKRFCIRASFPKVGVSEPDVEDTISILRGLKERYEVYHGVRIQDRALVAAVNYQIDILLIDSYLTKQSI